MTIDELISKLKIRTKDLILESENRLLSEQEISKLDEILDKTMGELSNNSYFKLSMESWTSLMTDEQIESFINKIDLKMLEDYKTFLNICSL